MKSKTKVYLFTIIFIVFLALIFLILSWSSLTGKTYVLDTKPVDPLDMFKGQYISINYDISRISNLSAYGINASQELLGNDLYVILEKDSVGIYRAKNYSLNMPASGDFIKGEIKYVYDNSMFVSYGIEQYFLEKNAELSTQNITIEVKVSDSGKATISRLFQNGKSLGVSYIQSILG